LGKRCREEVGKKLAQRLHKINTEFVPQDGGGGFRDSSHKAGACFIIHRRPKKSWTTLSANPGFKSTTLILD
jgi:hypothetical protein